MDYKYLLIIIPILIIYLIFRINSCTREDSHIVNFLSLLETFLGRLSKIRFLRMG